MARVTVPNLEDGVVSILRQRATAHGHSLSAEIRQALRVDAAPDRDNALERLAMKRKELASKAFPEPGASA